MSTALMGTYVDPDNNNDDARTTGNYARMSSFRSCLGTSRDRASLAVVRSCIRELAHSYCDRADMGWLYLVYVLTIWYCTSSSWGWRMPAHRTRGRRDRKATTERPLSAVSQSIPVPYLARLSLLKMGLKLYIYYMGHPLATLNQPSYDLKSTGCGSPTALRYGAAGGRQPACCNLDPYTHLAALLSSHLISLLRTPVTADLLVTPITASSGGLCVGSRTSHGHTMQPSSKTRMCRA
jgi:hypothetical protein